MANKGLQRYHADEHTGLSVLGAGREIIKLTGDGGGYDYENMTFTAPEYCIAIKNIDAGGCAISARSVVGDDFSTSGVFEDGLGARYLEIAGGDTIYGVFDIVSLQEPGSGQTITIQITKGGQ